MNNRSLFLLPVLFFLIPACKHKIVPRSEAEIKAKENYNRQALAKIDSCSAMLKDGCIVLRRGNDVISEMFSLLNKTDKTFSHCGIAFREKDTWYVYHSIGGEDNPDEKMRRDTYTQFIHPEHNLGLGICDLSLTKPQEVRLRKIVDSFYHKQVPFDMKFDLESNDRLYCAEMLYKAYNYALGYDSVFTTTTHQGFTYVSTDNIFVNKHAILLCRVIY